MRTRSILASLALAATLGACTNAEIDATLTKSAAAVALALDSGIAGSLVAADVPVACAVLSSVVGFAEDAVSAGLASPGGNFAVDVVHARAVLSGACLSSAGANAVSDVSSAVAAIESDVGGVVTAVAAVATSPYKQTPVVAQVRRLRLQRHVYRLSRH